MNPDRVGARALRYWETRQAVLSHNLANVETPGYKAVRVFARLLDDATMVADARTDFSSGSLTPTDRPLDVALTGDGFLVVETPAGRRWTRGGSFALDESGTLVNTAGHPVLGHQGKIVLPAGQIDISAGGTLSVDGAPVGKLLIERTNEWDSLEREGANMWLPAGDRKTVPEDAIQVHQGHLEDSNVEPVSALVEMIEIQRAYSAVQRSIQTADGVMGTITNQIGRIG